MPGRAVQSDFRRSAVRQMSRQRDGGVFLSPAATISGGDNLEKLLIDAIV